MSVTTLFIAAVVLFVAIALLVVVAIRTAPLMPDDYEMNPWDREGYWDE